MIRPVGWIVLLLGAAAAQVLSADSSKPADPPPGVRSLGDLPGVHNLFQLNPNLFSGSTPEGDEGFEALAKLGVRTIVSVDGARPEMDRAKAHGMRYVHLPHGYDGINGDLQLRLAKLAAELPGPIYVHCHHGKHRGPTAAAVLCLADSSWTPEQAETWLRLAGTSPDYPGLYKVVREFQAPTPQALAGVPSDFPETARVSGLVESMVAIDGTWERLRAVKSAGYAPPPDHPDVDPANEAVILWEHYREAQRLEDSIARGEDFMKRLREAEAGARGLHSLLREHAEGEASIEKLDAAFAAAARSCATCHRAHRNTAGAGNP